MYKAVASGKYSGGEDDAWKKYATKTITRE